MSKERVLRVTGTSVSKSEEAQTHTLYLEVLPRGEFDLIPEPEDISKMNFRPVPLQEEIVNQLLQLWDCEAERSEQERQRRWRLSYIALPVILLEPTT